MVAKKRVVGYIRVSTDQQAEHGSGLTYQKRAIELWCHRNGFELTTVFSDEGVSGGEQIDQRVGLPLALSSCTGPEYKAPAAADADGIVVYRLDRLARDMILQEWIIRELGRHAGRLYSCQDAEQQMLDDPTDPQRTMMRQILGAFAQYESQMIRARLMAGKRIKREHGGYIGGTPPYGTCNAGGGELAICEDEMVVLNRMMAIRSEGISYAKVGDLLNAEGHRTRTGVLWSAPRVQQILARTAPALAAPVPSPHNGNYWGNKKRRRPRKVVT